MKLYVLCSYGDGLNAPDVSTDCQELYVKMEKSYRMTLDHVSQTEEEQENTYLSGYSARAVIQGDWMEWSITELEIPISRLSYNPKAQMYSEPPDFRAAHFLQQNPENPEFSFSLLDRHILFVIINLQLWR